jgi:hypothetical protein
MIVPDETNPGWSKAISGEKALEFEFLATKILMGRLVRNYKADPTLEKMKTCVQELRAFFVKNEQLSKAHADLTRIFG